jgi:chromosome segregation ATPase
MLQTRTGQEGHLKMRSPRAGVSTGKSNVPAPGRIFRSEMERQLLAIQEAFSTAVNDNDRRKQDLEDRLREMEREAERQKKDAEDRLRSIERQKQDVEDQLRETARQLRKLERTPLMRIIRFFKRLNPLWLSRKQSGERKRSRRQKADESCRSGGPFTSAAIVSKK